VRADSGTVLTAQQGDTLSALAQRLYGDSSLWYVLADANGLPDRNAALPAGTLINAPAVVRNSNTFATFEPYDPGARIGQISPAQVMPPPPPSKGGCGALGTLIMVVVAVVVTAATYGAMGGSALAGLQAIGAGAVSAAAGSAASQIVGLAIGAQDRFSWKQVGLAALGGAVSAGLGLPEALGKAGAVVDLQTGLQAAGRAMLNNAITQGLAVATGLQDSFSWKAVAVSGLVAPVAQYAGAQAGDWAAAQDSGRWGQEMARSAASGVTGGLIRAAAYNRGKIDWSSIAADAFGNAIGNSVVDSMTRSSSPMSAEAARDKAQDLLSRAGLRSSVDDRGRVWTQHLEFDADGLPDIREGLVAGRAVETWLKEGRTETEILKALGSDNLRTSFRSFDLAEESGGLVIVGPLTIPGIAAQSVGGVDREDWAKATAQRAVDVLGHVVDGASALSRFAEEHPLLATMGVTAAQAAVTGGPVSGVVKAVALSAGKEILGVPNVYDVTQSAVRDYLKDRVGLNSIAAEILGHGAGFAADFIVGSAKNVLSNSKTIRGLVDDYGNVIQKHHSDPVFMKDGIRRSTDSTVPIPAHVHKDLHNDLNDFLKTKTNAQGYDMLPAPGYPGRVMRDQFTRNERIDAMREFYLKHEAKYQSVADDFFRQHGRR
jgi:phage tail protein X